MTRALLDYQPQFAALELQQPALRPVAAEQDELDELEFAAALLEVRSPPQLAQLLNRLQARAGLAPGSAQGRALAALLSATARRTLPVLERALSGRPGSARASGTAAAAGRYFGLELEGLSPEDQEFEAARRFVRLANSATRTALRLPGGNAQSVARAALHRAAQRHAPGLLPAQPGRKSAGARSRLPGSEQGRWVRQGHHIIVDNS